MGTSYQTLLVVGELARVTDALAADGVEGLVMPAGAGRTAVIPREGRYDYVDPAKLAKSVSARAGFPVLSNEVVDSNVVLMYAFRDGRLTHEYVSDQAMLVDWFIDDDGTTKFRLDGVEHPGHAPYPQGPRGADPAMFAPFGVGQVDLDRLAAALRGEFDGGAPLYAEFQHRLILKAMNLDPRGLTTALRWARLEDLPGSVRVREVRQRPDESHGQTITVVIETGLPLDADPLEAAQVIADAVVGGPLPMRADVGYVAVIPGAAAAHEIIQLSKRLAIAPRRATYFVALHVATGADIPENGKLVKAAEQAWATALRSRYGLDDNQGPVVAVMAPEPFAVGFGAAQGHRSTRTAT